MKAQQIRCLVCGFTAMLIFEKTQKIVSLEAMWYCPHCGSEDTENMAGIQGIKRLKDSLITAYKEAFRHYYENKGLSQGPSCSFFIAGSIACKLYREGIFSLSFQIAKKEL